MLFRYNYLFPFPSKFQTSLQLALVYAHASTRPSTRPKNKTFSSTGNRTRVARVTVWNATPIPCPISCLTVTEYSVENLAAKCLLLWAFPRGDAELWLGSIKVFWFVLFPEIYPIAAKPRQLGPNIGVWNSEFPIETSWLVPRPPAQTTKKLFRSLVRCSLQPLFAPKAFRRPTKNHTERTHRHARRPKERTIFQQPKYKRDRQTRSTHNHQHQPPPTKHTNRQTDRPSPLSLLLAPLDVLILVSKLPLHHSTHFRTKTNEQQ